MAKRHLSFGWIAYLCLAPLCVADLALANGSLFAGAGMFVKARHDPTPVAITRPAKPKDQVSSLFQKAPKTGLFADFPPATAQGRSDLKARSSQLIRLRNLIQSAESRRDGYNAVQHGATIKPGKQPTHMTLAEIDAWIDDTPGQPHAIGRYQFIPDTLRRVTAKLGLKPDTPFSPHTQDKLADVLLAEAGINKLTENKITRADFMLKLAKIWAGFPLENGKSYYDGHAGNKASISWASFNREMTNIFPDPARAPDRLAAR